MAPSAIILIVEDQELHARGTARLLERFGHHVRIETDGYAAIAVLESDEPFDLILLDVLMPKISGSGIFNRISETAPARIRRIVFLTGMDFLAEGWLRSTGRPVIEKGRPDMIDKLFDAVNTFIALPYPRGPKDMPRRPPSHPDLDSLPPISGTEDETTDVTALARSGDVIAMKIKHIESKHRDYREETDRRLTEIEGHFKEKGMVTEMSTDIKIAKSWIKNTPLLIAAIFTVITTAAGGVAYMIHSSERDHDLQLEQKRHDEIIQKTSNQLPTPPPSR